jgi:sphingomyelin phosphodiesterase
MTPTSGHPSFRVYSVDPETFGILDAETYIASMDNEAAFQSGPKWTKYYSAKDTYGPLVTPNIASNAAAELTPAFWHNVTVVLENSDDQFAAYYARKSRGWEPASCDADCKKEEICGLRALRSESNCHVTKPGVHFNKRDHDHGHGDECEGTVMKMVLRGLVGRDQTRSAVKELESK